MPGASLAASCASAWKRFGLAAEGEEKRKRRASGTSCDSCGTIVSLLIWLAIRDIRAFLTWVGFSWFSLKSRMLVFLGVDPKSTIIQHIQRIPTLSDYPTNIYQYDIIWITNVFLLAKPCCVRCARLTFMKNLGYNGYFETVDAHGWLPQRRKRVFMVFVLSGHGSPEAVFGTLHQTKPQVVPDITNFLQPLMSQESPDIRPLKSKSDKNNKNNKVMKWHLKTNACMQAWHCKPEVIAWAGQHVLRYKCFHKLTPRCQRSLLLHCAHLQTHHGVDPFVQPCFLDLSQCVSRTPLGQGFVPCLTPKGQIWATHLHRFLSGEECARLMGLRAHEIPMVSGVFLKDLVGNSFCLPILVGLWLGILTKVTI